ncbi:tyramine oxidase [Rhodococcus rhodochrous]|uniref:primary-amine oxidase n=1 Tax=Rhodococcus TaxID=1827 RepID=UPI000750E3CA|nr:MULTISPECIES: primary-amine oxidase [Rhodococcus]MDC3727529.1 primary-amine oxidase [Rhodococcus sp. Rp3]MDO1485917.1 primary-amine oxidase [Rhodococcus rhodochrous]TWH44764.1 primary-amine oxidase [Rhodococcus rhodochrous J38]SNV23773.1 tyramine oxidase [Rhodococcus rhodochrous]
MSAYAPTQGKVAVSSHPLDPLAREEIDAAVALVRADARTGDRLRFWGATLDEAHARAVLAGAAPAGERKVGLVVMDYGNNEAWEVDVLLGEESRIRDWRAIDPRRPGITSEEARAAAQACRENPEFRAALAKRGITDVSLVMVDAESMGGFVPDEYKDRRVTWGTVWHRVDEDDNGYARPVQGVVPIIDMQTMEVLEVEDHGVVPISEETGNYDNGLWEPDREGLAPLEVVQPEGTSFDVEGWKVTWQGWEFRLGFTHREGLVLYDLTFKGRSILKRVACNEMYVPYLDSNSTQYRKNFFDWGEYGAGPLTNSLALGCDCLGVIHYFDATVLGGDGVGRTIPQAICMHEEDDSVLWKHTDMRRDVGQVRRARKLIISNFQTVANYDYGFYWSLHQDGTIKLAVKLTGLMSASGIEEGEEAPYGRVVSKNVQTPNHQHFFGLRLDTAIDGPLNRIVEEHAEVDPDPEKNPWGNAVRTVRVPLLNEKDAAQRNDASVSRHWRIESAERTNRYGEPTGYRLLLPNTTIPFSTPDSVMARRAPFTHNHLWATPYDPAEQYVGGQYPNQAEPGEDGVQVWQQKGRSLDGAELVLWPVIGVMHFPRPEQWPIMPVEQIGFMFEPDGFFDRNPAMDIPAPTPHCSTESGGESACCGS